MRSLYRQARVVAYPSAYEGFSTPPIEAMAQGIPPVAASNLPVIREVTGGPTLLVDQSTGGWTARVA